MIYSMTGYAAQMRDIGRGILHLELRTVNSRYLDMNFRIVEEVRIVEPALREMISGRLNRGKVDCRLNLLPSTTAPREASLNRALLQQLAALQLDVRAQLPEAAALSVNDVLRWPGMLGDDQIGADTLQAECATLAKAALDELLATRAREGEKLAGMILERVERMRALVAEAGPKLPQALADYQERMAIRLREAAASLDEERIRQEMGLFATRIDVAEELNRLVAHLDEVARVVGKGGAIGKRLDFLMQELNREANTLASKSVSTEISAIAVDMKLLIEQMREQVQNIE
ncbi:MAG: YicC/YloC family endoribonuclease [Rhodocyclaceae bacterium]|nr:YicC/YloC family endoribonuclease [Rhodocyclaceae bacterium]